jgi:hypothetical protein
LRENASTPISAFARQCRRVVNYILSVVALYFAVLFSSPWRSQAFRQAFVSLNPLVFKTLALPTAFRYHGGEEGVFPLLGRGKVLNIREH